MLFFIYSTEINFNLSLVFITAHRDMEKNRKVIIFFKKHYTKLTYIYHQQARKPAVDTYIHLYNIYPI